MTNEQKVRVDRLERYLITDREKTYTTVRVNDLDTALSLIKEQQEEIEKKDKQIDLMAESIEKVTVDMKIAFGENMLWDRREIKQYFAGLVEKE